MRITARIIATLACALAITGAARAQSADGRHTYFPYPIVPESMQGITERSNFLMEHFWDFCDFKTAFSSKSKMQAAFNDYAAIMPFATAENTRESIDRLIKQVSKNPKNLLSLAEMAEGAFYADTAQIRCDDCYLPFARAAAANKKISKAERARFDYQARSLGGSQVGMTAPDFMYTTPDGQTGRLSEIAEGPYILLFVNDPTCDECNLARIRLQADISLDWLIDNGHMKVISIYPGLSNPEWVEQAKDYSDKWIVGACPDIDELYDMRQTPTIYYLNGKHQILSKSFDIDRLLNAFYIVAEKFKKSAQ